MQLVATDVVAINNDKAMIASDFALVLPSGELFWVYALYTVSQKRPTFTTCYNFYIHSSIATIFGTNVAEKVGNQNVLYFPTTPN